MTGLFNKLINRKAKKIAFFGVTFLFVALSLFSGFSGVFAAAGVPKIISYQGRLSDSGGTLQTGTFYFKFSIWDSPTSSPVTGTRLWPASAPASTTAAAASGVFNVNIGDTANGYPDVLNYDFSTEANVYLQVEVSSNGTSFETLSPRQRIAASGFAINADTLSGNLQASSTSNFTFNVLNQSTGQANLNIATGSLLFGGAVRIDRLGQGTFATTTISSLTVTGSSTLAETVITGQLTLSGMSGTKCLREVNGVVTVAASDCGTSGSSTAAGLNTQIQFNNDGAFGGDANFTWVSSTKLFTITGTSSLQGLTFTNATGTGTFSAGTSTINGNLTIASNGNLILGATTRIDYLGQGTLATTTISALTISGISGLTQCLRVDSSGVVSGSGSNCATFTTTTISAAGTTLSQTAYTFATSGNSGLSISANGSTLTWTLATATANQSGFLASADFATFSAKITTTSLSATAPIVYNNSTGAFTFATTSITGSSCT
ncbi:MAG: hypothetical protein Q7S36_02735, partial [Candidatus Liptonbacteria bacterium]|nr:hypothetical protein [Candidatus Liptonbacteria bacterium]